MALSPQQLVVTVWVLSLVVCAQSQFLDLPDHLRNNDIFSYLNLNAKIKCIASLNRNCHLYFTETHGKEMHFVKQLNIWFADGDNGYYITKIPEMTQYLQLSELYLFYLPKMMQNLFKNWINNALSNKRDKNNNVVIQTLHAMHLRPLSINEFNNNMTSLPDSIKLLLLSSRGLLNYFIPSYAANTDKHGKINLGIIKHHQSGMNLFKYFSNYPWLRPDFSRNLNPNTFKINDWALYFCYLYKYYFNQIFGQQSLFNLDDASKAKLLSLINDYGFIPWTLNTIQSIQTDSLFDSCDLYEVYTDLCRVQLELSLDNIDNVAFQTYLMLNLQQKDQSFCGEGALNDNLFKQDLLSLSFVCWQCNKYPEFDGLIDILSDSLVTQDNFIMDIVDDNYNDSDFRENVVYQLYEQGNVLFFDEEGKIQQILIKSIIDNSQYYWFHENDVEKSMKEMSKLTLQSGLLDHHLFEELLENEQSVDNQNNTWLVKVRNHLSPYLFGD